MLSILIVEDDPVIGHATQLWLAEDHACQWAQTLQSAMDIVDQQTQEKQHFDIILLDLRLPDGSGFDFLNRLKRQKNNAGIIIMTAHGEIDDRVKGLDLGADDYLVKPIDFKELGARIRAVKRRRDGVNTNIIEHLDLQLDVNGKTLLQDNQAVHLSNREMDLLTVLMQGRGRYYNKAMLEQRLYEGGQEIESNSIEVHISSLRKKLGKSMIKTTRGLGYIIEKASN